MPRKPPRTHGFKPGNKANPLGAGAHNQDLKKVRRLTREMVAELGQLVLEGDLAALQAIKDDPKSTVLKVWFAAIAIKSMTRGDAHAFNIILDRIVGKTKDEITVSAPDGESGNTAKVIVFQVVNGTKD